MSQKDILDYLLKIKKPVTKNEIYSSFKINNTSITRGLGKLVKSNQIKKDYFTSGTKKYRRVLYFLK